MTDKHQALRDALNRAYIFGQRYWSQADSESYSENRRSDETKSNFETWRDGTIRALLADHDRMREALHGLLNALPSATTHPAIKAAREALKEGGR